MGESAVQHLHPVVLHVVVVGRHEENVDDDAERNEELREGVEHDDRHYLNRTVQSSVKCVREHRNTNI